MFLGNSRSIVGCINSGKLLVINVLPDVFPRLSPPAGPRGNVRGGTPPSFRGARLLAGEPGIQHRALTSGFPARPFSDKIDVVNFTRNSRPGMTAVFHTPVCVTRCGVTTLVIRAKFEGAGRPTASITCTEKMVRVTGCLFGKRASEKSTRKPCIAPCHPSGQMHVIRESNCDARNPRKVRKCQGPAASMTCTEKWFA
jgi:hypothetical protein